MRKNFVGHGRREWDVQFLLQRKFRILYANDEDNGMMVGSWQ